MSTESRYVSHLKVVPAGDGDEAMLGPGVGVAFKIAGEDTGGAVAVVEHELAVGALVPPHVHTREDEISIVLEGEIGFRSDDQEAVLGAGGYIVKPRGQVHAMWNARSVPARMIEIITPAGFEDFFRELSELTASGEIDIPAIDRLGERYALGFAEPDWLPDLVAGYGLNYPPQV